jgi:hypothetical protein
MSGGTVVINPFIAVTATAHYAAAHNWAFGTVLALALVVLLHALALLAILGTAARHTRDYLERRALVKLLTPVKIPAQRAGQDPRRATVPAQRRAPVDRY